MTPARPVVGIVGSAGGYGRWLAHFFRERMQLEVLGHDPADATSSSPDEVLARADVLVFSVPIRHTPAVIEQWTTLAAGREAGQLWLDITSVKEAPVAAMLASRAEVAGLHPMCAPPKAPTLRGRAMVVCAARLQQWQPWFDALCRSLEAQCVASNARHHDQVMALVQAMVHAGALAQAGVLRDYVPELGTLESLMPFRSTGFELDMAVVARILALNPAIYEDIQFGNSYVAPMLARFADALKELHGLVVQGDDVARARFREGFLAANRRLLGESWVEEGNYSFERLGYLLADLAEATALSIHLPDDRPGALRELLQVFEQHGVNLASIHSSRTPAGEVHFRIGFEPGLPADVLGHLVAEVNGRGIGRVLSR